MASFRPDAETFRSPLSPRAAVRIRPFFADEVGLAVRVSATSSRSAEAPAAVRLRSDAQDDDGIIFPSHFVFTDQHAQAILYRDFMSKAVEEVMQGVSAAVISCGPPSSGKSHTLLGYGADPGLIPHVTLEIFRHFSATAQPARVWCSFLEVHNEEVMDLLAPLPPLQSKEANLEVVEMPGASAHVLGLTQCFVESVGEVQQLVDYGNKKRAARSKLLGVHGYSHTVLSLAVEPAGSAHQQRPNIAFVDCASYNSFKDVSLLGLSEALKDLALGGARARGLGKAFFRRSALTQLLEDALCCRDRLLLIATLSQGQAYSEAAGYLEMVQGTVEAAARIDSNGEGPSASTPLLDQAIEALQRSMQRSRFGPEIALKEARLATLQRVSAERFARTAPLKEQAAGTKALLQAQMQSLRDWGFASDEDLASAAAYLPRLHSDPMLTGCLAYAVYPYGSRILGSAQGLSMQGLGIAPEHCEIFDTGGGLWLKHLAPGRYRLCLNDKILDGTTPEPLTNGDRLQLGWAHELLVVTDERSEMCPEVRKDPATRPMASLIDEANELAKELDHLQIASQESKFFEVVDSLPPSMTVSAATQEPLIRLRHRSQVMEDAVTVWPVSDFRSEVKRMRDLFRAPPPTCSAAGSKVLDVEEGQSGAESRDDAGSMTKIELHKEANISSPGPASPEDCSILSSLQRARRLSQNIGDTVFALQDTVAELKRTAASARAVPMEVLTKLREDCAEMKSRLERLETRAGQAQAQDATRHRAMALAPQHRDSALPTQRRYSMPAPVTVRPCAVQAWRGPSQPIRHTFSEPTSRAAWLSRDASCQRIAYSLTASAARGRRCSSPGAQRSPLVVQVPGSVVSYNLHGMLANGMVSPKNVRTPFIAQPYVRP